MIRLSITDTTLSVKSLSVNHIRLCHYLKVNGMTNPRCNEYFGFTDAEVDDLLADPQMPPKDYWSNTSGNDFVKRFIYMADQTTKDEIERLINGESVVKSVKQELTYSDLDRSIENLWSILFFTGYLTQREFSYEEVVELVIPNKEIMKLFIRLSDQWFRDVSRADLSRITKFCDSPNRRF